MDACRNKFARTYLCLVLSLKKSKTNLKGHSRCRYYVISQFISLVCTSLLVFTGFMSKYELRPGSDCQRSVPKFAIIDDPRKFEYEFHGKCYNNRPAAYGLLWQGVAAAATSNEFFGDVYLAEFPDGHMQISVKGTPFGVKSKSGGILTIESFSTDALEVSHRVDVKSRAKLVSAAGNHYELTSPTFYEWRIHEPNGEGSIRFADARTYSGRISAGQPHGFGVMGAPDGSKFQGYFRDGKRFGPGKSIGSDGVIKQEGKWLADEFVSPLDLKNIGVAFLRIDIIFYDLDRQRYSDGGSVRACES